MNPVVDGARDASETLITSWAKTYDAEGYVLTETDGDGNVTSYTYNALGEVLTTTVRDAEETLIRSDSASYDRNGNVLTRPTATTTSRATRTTA